MWSSAPRFLSRWQVSGGRGLGHRVVVSRKTPFHRPASVISTRSSDSPSGLELFMKCFYLLLSQKWKSCRFVRAGGNALLSDNHKRVLDLNGSGCRTLASIGAAGGDGRRAVRPSAGLCSNRPSVSRFLRLAHVRLRRIPSFKTLQSSPGFTPSHSED